MLVYECEGTEPEIKQWFQTINIAGVPLTRKNSSTPLYSGAFVTAAEAVYSSSASTNMQKWLSYVKRATPSARRCWPPRWPGFPLSRASRSTGTSPPTADTDCAQLQAYFNEVISWISQVFTRSPDPEMRGLEWARALLSTTTEFV